MEFVFEAVLLLITFLLDLLTGHWGFYLPLGGALFFYLAVSRSFGGAMFLAVLYGGAADLLYNRPVPLCAAVPAGALILVYALRPHPRNADFFSLMLLGTLGGAVNALGMEFLALLNSAQGREWDYRIAQLLFGALAGALLYPSLTMLLDALAGRLDLVRFRPTMQQNDQISHPRKVLRRHLALKDGR